MRIGRKKKSCWLVVWVLLEHSKRQCKSKVMGSSFATQFFKFVLFQSLQESTLVLHKLFLDLRDPRRRDVTANSVQRTVFFLAMIIRHKRSTRKRPLSAYKKHLATCVRTDQQLLQLVKFFLDKCTCSKASMVANKTCQGKFARV